jgi:NitT/TauT family transport system substrate-binding protein
MPNTDRRRVLKSIGTGILGVGLAGCTGGDGDGGDGDDGGGVTKAAEPIETGVVVPHFGLWDTTIAFLAGQEQNFFVNAGLDVSKIDVSGGGGNVRTVVSGDADIGHATGIAALFAAYREGTDVRIVSNEINKSTDMFFYTLADSEYDSIDDLEGASVGYSSPGSSTNMVALSAVQDVDGAEAVSVGGPPDANAALEGGEVDLAWSVPPFFLDGVEAGDYKIVFRGSEVNPFNALSIRVNFVGNNVLNDDPGKVADYFSAHKQALDWAYDNLDDALQIWGEAIDNDNYDLLETAVLDGYPREVLTLDELKGLDAANQLAVDFDFIDSELSDDEINELVDTSPLPGTSGDTYS